MNQLGGSHEPIRLYDRLVGIADQLQPFFLLGIRLYIGYQSVTSGWAHLHNVANMTSFFASLRIPFPHVSVYLSGWTELVGGALLLIGLFSRPVALVLTLNFLVAMFTVEYKNYSFSLRQLAAQIWANQNPILGDTAFPFLATSLVILLFGPGWLSVDHWMSRRAQRAEGRKPCRRDFLSDDSGVQS